MCGLERTFSTWNYDLFHSYSLYVQWIRGKWYFAHEKKYKNWIFLENSGDFGCFVMHILNTKVHGKVYQIYVLRSIGAVLAWHVFLAVYLAILCDILRLCFFGHKISIHAWNAIRRDWTKIMTSIKSHIRQERTHSCFIWSEFKCFGLYVKPSFYCPTQPYKG